MDSIFALVIGALLMFSVRSEPEFPPWHLDRLDQRRGIDSAPFNVSIVARTRPVLYVVDSGVDHEHIEFTSGTSKVLDGYNFVEESWDSGDCMGHGTHVAALATGAKYGVAGSIGVDIVSVRILDCKGRGSCSSMIRALEWVHRNHSAMRAGVPGVVVMSIGSRQSECEAAHVLTESLSGQNIIVIAAAGNSGTDACLFHPASAKTAITVGAMEIRNAGDTAWSKTNFGSCVDVYAPGVSIESAWPDPVNNNASKVLSGTSMAAPLLAGQALLIVSAIPGISVVSARKIMEESASRGTLLGSQIDPEAPGSRVAHVPWLNLQPDRVVSISQNNMSLTFREKRVMYDTVVIEIETSSGTSPAMQYEVDHIATKLLSQLKQTREKVSSTLFVNCLGSQSFQQAKSRLVMPASRSARTRGWDFRQKNDDVGTFTLSIACNISCDAGTGTFVEEDVSHLFKSGRLQSITGKSATLLSKPAVTRALTRVAEKHHDGLNTWKILAISISILGLVLSGVIALVILLPRRRRSISR